MVTRIELEPTSSTPYLARRLVTGLIDRGPVIKAVDAALLVSELATSAAEDAEGPVLVKVANAPRHTRVSVASKSGPIVDDMAARLLDRLADRWEPGPPPWFEVDLVRTPRLDDASEGHLWSVLGSDPAAREELFARYEGLAGSVARRFRRIGESSDVDQVACIALVGAIDRFDVDRGVKFSTYAAKSISGELKRFLRDTAWGLKVPRGLKEAALTVTRERERLSQRLGRRPEVDELADATGLTPDEVREALGAGQAFGPASLDAPAVADGTETVIDTLGEDDPALAGADTWLLIEPLLEQLSVRDQQILHLRFFEELSQAEIAEIVGVSQMQISRILAATLELLRSGVGEE